MTEPQWDVVHERMVEHPGGVFFEVRFRHRPWWRRLWMWMTFRGNPKFFTGLTNDRPR